MYGSNPHFDKTSFLKFAIQIGVLEFPRMPQELRSGMKSDWYVNWRPVSGDLAGGRILAAYISDFIGDQGINSDCVFGVPNGATVTAVRTTDFMLSRSPHRPDFGEVVVPQGRKEPKGDIDPQYEWFSVPPRGKTLVLEDVTSSGASLLEWISRISDLGAANVAGVIALTDREQRGKYGGSISDELRKMRIPFFAMSTAYELLQTFDRITTTHEIRTREIVREALRGYNMRIELT